MTDATVITRFAPSPTGALHVGGARTALFNYAYARRHGGKFLLRLEDTDRKRSTTEAEQGILEDLKWLGLTWDNEGEEPRQSQRLDLYQTYFGKLFSGGRIVEEDNGAWRFKVDASEDFVIDDQVLGRVTVPADKVEDFVIKKADGFPTYHFAVVVDDADMGVTHVIRGQEHLNNTAKHMALQQALGLPTPTYSHIPLIFNPDGSKMSKRDKAKAARAAAKQADMPENRFEIVGDVQAFLAGDSDDLATARAIANALNLTLPEIDVADFRASGYLPEVLCNYLALLGWNPGNDLEQFDNAFLCEHFDFDRVGSSAARFDREKLAAFNADFIAALPPEDLATRLWAYGHDTFNMRFIGPDDEHFSGDRGFAEAYRPRMRTLRDAMEQGAFFFKDDDAIAYDFDAKPVKKVIKGDAFELLAALRDNFEALAEDNFGQAGHEAIKALSEEKGVGMGKIAQPLRVAISGGTVTPPIDATLDILGKDSTLARISHCLAASGR